MISRTQLAWFAAMHAGFRHELGRLAYAAESPRDRAHEELLEAQLVLVLDLLRTHHAREERHVWPYLLERSPESAGAIAALGVEHDRLVPLIRTAGDTGTPLTRRADTLHRLHHLLDDHLAHEERVVLPLVLAHYTPELLDADRRRTAADIGRERLALVVGWLASSLDDMALATNLAEQPALVQYLFRRFWWPEYQQRMTALYGAAARPVSSTLARGLAA